MKKEAIFVEKRTELKTFRVQMFCGCGGEMKPTGLMLCSDPPQFPHQCSLCDMQKTYEARYPHTEYREVVNE